MAKAAKKAEFDEENEAELASAKSDSTIVELDQNLEDYEDFEPLPAGGYPFAVTKAEMRTSDKGNDYYYTSLTIHPDDFPPDYDKANAPDGLNLVYARMMKPDPKNRRSITAVKNFMRAIGLSTKTNIIDPSKWETRKGKVILKRGKFNGQPNNDIVGIERLDD
jgi:hypothetical protein